MVLRHLSVLFLCAVILTSACGSKSPSTPSDPPSNPPPAGSFLSLTGSITSAGVPIPSARVDITEGVNAGRSAVADATGRYTLADLSAGAFTVRVSSEGFVAQSSTVTLSVNLTVDFTLAAVPAGNLSVTGIVMGIAGPVGGARVDVLDGVNAGRSTVADAGGHYTLTNLTSGAFTLRVSATGFVPQSTPVTLADNDTVDFTLAVAGVFTSGRIIDVLTSNGVGNATIAGDGLTALTDLSGAFGLIAPAAADGPRMVKVTAGGRVDRETSLRVPGADVVVSMIPASFDLRAFDEMFRVPQLLRWTSPPPVRLERRTVQYTDVNMTSAQAIADAMSDAEANAIMADLTWALPQLTGGTFTSFASVTPQTSSPGSTVPLLNSGVITIARVAGLTSGSTFWGYSRWQFRSDGTVVGGLLMIDRDFDRSGSAFTRSLRSHELGHTLGYNHVSARTSVMNSNARTEPNGFDLDACRIAFQRPPGNRAPDVDPGAASLNRVGLTTMWSPPIR